MKKILSIALLAAGLVSTDAVAQNPQAGLPVPKQPAPAAAVVPQIVPPDNGRGMALLAAEVQTTGALLNGAGATGANRIGTGIYEVFFNRDVTQCFYQAVSFLNHVALFVEPRSGAANGVFVEFFTLSNTLADSRFYLTVFCNR